MWIKRLLSSGSLVDVWLLGCVLMVLAHLADQLGQARYNESLPCVPLPLLLEPLALMLDMQFAELDLT